MSGDSSIEWTDATWNPVRGCDKISPGCKHCYAETFAERWRGVKGHAYEQGFDLRLVPSSLDWPLRRRKPLDIFVNSMSDLFHKDIPNEYIAAVFGVMRAAPRHRFQVLTKRAARLPEWFAWHAAEVKRRDLHWEPWRVCEDEAREQGVDDLPAAGCVAEWPSPNVWIGVSCEDHKHGLPRLEHLRNTPAAVRFVSFEPLLEDLGAIDLTGIHWAIVGGESGHGARPMDVEWMRNIKDQCVAAGVKFFGKQLGGVKDKRPLPILDGQQWTEMPR